MGGVNPYIQQPDVTMPTGKYKITFMPINVTVDVDPEKFPYEHNGLPGSILDIALGNGIEMDHACGGVCACSTCHVVVKEGLDTLNEPTEEEEDQLEEAPGLKPTSRLACQSVPDGTTDIVVEIPEWNRNLVQEGQ
ncbi:MAG: 2Fe-2S iron-sulfur cluster binding domain-containing protein [Phycisphaerales bacterium]|nr:MAG: 2Fe-2S iron-sulfur cluster binding domain-containing protein [Phycisphaerales bacterium]